MEGEKLGKYEIRRTLGRGAMGVVYEGWDPAIARKVAIKTVALASEEDAEAREGLARFQREAQAAGRLQHPNIVGVFDYGETATLAYIVMEFVDGESLKAVLDRGERFPLAETVRILEELLNGLGFSHERGVVHRDIKPANIMLTRSGGVKIADFGIARIESSSMTQAGTVLGTPAYMSPEQFKGEPVDARTDIYSTGVVLYQLLTGEKPFEGSMSAIMHKVLTTTPPRPSELAVTATPPFDAVVAQAMAKRPDERFATAAAFAEAVRSAFAGAKPVVPDAPPDEGTVIAAATTGGQPALTPTTLLPTAAAARRSRFPVWIGAAAVAVIVVIGGLWFLVLKPAPKPTLVAAAKTTPAVGASQTPEPAGASHPAAPRISTAAEPAHPPQPSSAPIRTSEPSTPHATTTPTAPTHGATPAGTAAPPAATASPPATVPASPTPSTPAPPPQAPSAASAGQPAATTPAAVAPAPSAATAQPVSPALPPPAPPPPATKPTAPTESASQPTHVVANVAASPEAVAKAVAAAIAPVPCSLVSGSVATAGSISLAGLAGNGAPAALHQALSDAAPAAAVNWEITTFRGGAAATYCQALDLLRPVAAPFGASAGDFTLGLQNGQTVLGDGDPITFRLSMPGFPAWLTVDYFASDGSVAHLDPGPGNPAHLQDAGAEILLHGTPAWTVGPPFGRDMIVAIASSKPLFTTARPESEQASAYLPALEAALNAAQGAGERLDATAFLLETHETPKH